MGQAIDALLGSGMRGADEIVESGQDKWTDVRRGRGRSGYCTDVASRVSKDQD